MSISAISRVCGLSWSTVFRWLKKAAKAARSFNDRYVREFDLEELQADEIRTFCGTKKKPSFVAPAAIWAAVFSIRPHGWVGRT